MSTNEQVWLVGAGRMARAYAAVLNELSVPFVAIGRRRESAALFEAETGAECRPGGVEAALDAAGAAPTTAIVAIDIPALAGVAGQLMKAGVRRILLEKPGGVDAAEIDEIARTALATGCEVFVAYNRRFYHSIVLARAGLEEDGGAVSMSFDFTESSDAILKIGYPEPVLNNWLLANSTHVIDTAFHLAGAPAEWLPRTYGSLPWHPKAARFAGSGLTERGVMFSYAADWDAPGRWSIEIASRTRRFVLKPMEQLAVQRRGSFAVEPVTDEDPFSQYKPGLFRMTRAFLTGEGIADLPDIHAHLHRTRSIYAPMADPALLR